MGVIHICGLESPSSTWRCGNKRRTSVSQAALVSLSRRHHMVVRVMGDGYGVHHTVSSHVARSSGVLVKENPTCVAIWVGESHKSSRFSSQNSQPSFLEHRSLWDGNRDIGLGEERDQVTYVRWSTENLLVRCLVIPGLGGWRHSHVNIHSIGDCQCHEIVVCFGRVQKSPSNFPHLLLCVLSEVQRVVMRRNVHVINTQPDGCGGHVCHRSTSV